jgi:long-chain fatty acid transport protein
MAKRTPLLSIIGFMLLSTTAFAGSIDYLSNQSAEYLMTFSRNAATDAADAAIYNPAGLVFLPKDGLYVNASVQYIARPYSEDFLGLRYEQDEPDIIPNFFAVYKKDDLAAFFAVNTTAGGGKVKWADGNAVTTGLIARIAGISGDVVNSDDPGAGGTGAYTINEQWIEGSSIYTGIMAGLSYKINDRISLSLAPRYLIAKRSASAFLDFNMDAIDAASGNETRAVMDVDFDYNARGLGGIFGLDIKPFGNLNLGIRYETVTKLVFHHSLNRRSAEVTGPFPELNAFLSEALTGVLANLDKDGENIRYDLPATLGVGVEFAATPKLSLLSSFNYYFIENAVWDDEGVEEGTSLNSDYHNGWEASLGATYKITPALKIGAGYIYTVAGEKRDAYNLINPGLDSHAGALGFTYSATPNLDVTLALAQTWYISDSNYTEITGTSDKIDYKKRATDIAAGIQYRFDL